MAFRIAVSGLKSAVTDLDVTGNNIANANTTGFKASRGQFADIYAASNLGSGSDAVGQGVQLTAVAQQFTQGSIGFTDNSLDFAVNGEGFFVLSDAGAQTYSRSGAFGLDKDGFIVNSTGQNLIGFQADANGAITGAVDNLQISTANIAPSPSTSVAAELNLDAADPVPTVIAAQIAADGSATPAARAASADTAFDPANTQTYNNSTSLTVYDSLGEEHLAVFYFVKTDSNEWNVHMRVDNDNTQTLTSGQLTFDSAGAIASGGIIASGGFGTYTPTNGSSPIDLGLTLTGSTQFGADFGVNALSQDGFTTGRLSGVDVDDKGIVLARFTNGQSQAQGQIVLAAFSNPQGLQAQGDTSWAETSASGQALIAGPGSGTLGLIQAGALEESNVELSEQLVNMIIAQRAFQANAQVISTEDEITQTIINMR